MIDYKVFEYASPPRTGTTWVLHAAAVAGLGVGYKSHVHEPHEDGRSLLRVTTVRHPCDWLASYFAAIHRGAIHVQAVDRFARLPVGDFDDFVRTYLRTMPGAVGEMFLAYRADSYLRLEELPLAFDELLEACGVPQRRRNQLVGLGPQNTNNRELPLWSPSLHDRVLDAEREMMERFEYTCVGTL